MRKPQLTIRNGLIPNKDFRGTLLKKASSYQKLNAEVSGLIDQTIEGHVFLCNVEERLTVIRAHMQKQQNASAKRKLTKLLNEVGARLAPSEEVPF